MHIEVYKRDTEISTTFFFVLLRPQSFPSYQVNFDLIQFETYFSAELNIWISDLVFRTCHFGLILGNLSKPQRRRQQGHGKTKDLIGRTIAQHVRFKILYISQPSYAKREITTICVVCEPKPWQQIMLISIWNSTLFLNVMLKLRYGAVCGGGKHMQSFFKF